MALTSISTGGIKDAQVTAGKLHADALDRTYTLGADGSNHYTFTGEGLTGAVNDPTLYLTRGKTYRFVNGNSAGAHPFRIQTTVNGSAGTEYNTGVTNNGGAGGSTIVFEVPHAAPDVLYYQCTSHGSMGGIFYITGALADGTVTTAKLADQAVTLAKLPHGTSSNDGKFLRANNGADPSFETVTSTTINNNADNRVITGSGTANTLNGESNLTYNGTHLNIGASSVTEGEITGRIHRGDNNGNQIQFTSANTGTGNSYGLRVGWNGAQGQMFLYENADMRFATNATERMRIDSSGRVGIGVTSFHDTSTRLQLQGAGSDHTGIVVTAAGTSSLAYLYMGDTDDKDIGRLVYDNSTNAMQMWTNNAERMRISSAGYVTKPQTPSYFAYSTTTQTHLNNTFINPGGWSVSGVGKHNIGNHFNTSNTTFTAPVDGRYLVSMQYSFWYQNDGHEVDGHQVVLFVNNSAGNEYFLQGGLKNGAEGLVLGQAIVNLSANDTVQWKHDGYGGSGYYNNFTTFGYLLG